MVQLAMEPNVADCQVVHCQVVDYQVVDCRVEPAEKR